MNEDDRELEDYLGGDSPLSREYAARRGEEPPGKLDDAVLAAARRAAAFDRRRARYRRVRCWSISVAAAAVVVLGVTLVLDMLIFGGPDLIVPPMAQRLPVPAEDRAAVTEEMVQQQTQRMPAAPPPEQATTQNRAAGREEAAAAAADAAQPQLPARPASAEQTGAAAMTRQTPEADSNTRQAREEKELQRARATGTRLAAEDRYETPEDWLAEIRRLQQAGRTEQARKALSAFRASYPDHELPEDLQALAAADE